jgi:hypothetical protein
MMMGRPAIRGTSLFFWRLVDVTVEATREEMVRAVEEFLAADAPSLKVQERAGVAAEGLVRLGDAVAVKKMHGWRQSKRGVELFRAAMFEAQLYEIDYDGLRRELVLGYCWPMVRAEGLPKSAGRREVVEVMRPVVGTCPKCRGRMVALFDVLVDERFSGVAPARWPRVFIRFCPRCCEEAGAYATGLCANELVGAKDVDGWAVGEAIGEFPGLGVRGFRAAEGEGAEMSAWFGGRPRWVRKMVAWPQCEICRRRMVFAGQVVVEGASYYGFFCTHCPTSEVRVQRG